MPQFFTTIKIDDECNVVISKTQTSILIRAELNNTTGKNIRGMNIFICSLANVHWTFSERSLAKNIFGRLWTERKTELKNAVARLASI